MDLLGVLDQRQVGVVVTFSPLKMSDEHSLTDAAACLTEAEISLHEVITLVLDAKDDSIGIKAKLASVREALTKIHELVDHGDGILLDVTDHMRRCCHPQEGHQKSYPKNSRGYWFWSCGYCGDVYSGLKWVAQPDAVGDKA